VSQLRVLLVEDSRRLAERIRELIELNADATVVKTVYDEASAIETVRKERIDLMVLDLQLQSGTGFGVLEHLGPDRPPVVVLTNYALPQYEKRAHDLGVEYFLDKARDFERLSEIVGIVLHSVATRTD
jgi:two-component system, OmpR family, response regulator